MVATFIQRNKGTSANISNPSSAAWGSALGVGRKIILYIATDSGTANYVSAVTSTGVTWVRRASFGGGSEHAIWEGTVTSAVTTAMTFTFSQTSATRIVWIAEEWSGLADPAFDRVAATLGTGTSTTPLSNTSGTFAQADTLVTGHVAWTTGTSTLTAGTGYSNASSDGATTDSARFAGMESKVVAATTAQTAGFTLGTSRPWSAFVAGWKIAASAVDYTSTPTDTVGLTDSVEPVKGKIGLVIDTFDDGAIGDQWLNPYNATETGGRIRLATAADNNYAGLPTSNRDATASGSYVTWKTLPAASTSTEIYARHMHWSSATAGTGVGFDYSKQAGVMVARAVSYVSYFDGAPVTATIAADTTTGIEETGGTITWWTSTDGGQTKTTVRTMATPAWYGFVYGQLEAHRSADGTGDFVEFDNFNVAAGAYTATPTDNLGLTDSATAVQANVRTATDNLGLTDSVSTVISQAAGIPNDALGLTDSVSTVYSFGYSSTPVDPLGITDSVTIVRTSARVVGPDALGLTDSTAIVQANARTATDNLGLTDSATAVLGKVANPTDSLGLTDSVTAIITDEYAGEWQYIYVPWGTEQFTIPDLTPGMPYDLQIRAMDASGNASPWSDSEQLYGALDTTPPSTPAAPTVVSSKIALQVISTLGKASGGTYNLESDLALLEVHASSSAGFTPTTATKIGTMPADKGIMLAATPAVATFQTDALVAQYVRVIAIDKTGNRSPASATASAVPGLLDSAYISELTATKISAGTLGADIIVGARIKTANSGARVELNTAGLQAFNTGGTQTVGISAADGSAFFEGTVRTGSSGTRIIMDPAAGAPVIRFYPGSGTNYAFINATDNTTSVALGMNSSEFGTAPNNYQHRVYLTTTGAYLETFKPIAQTQRGGRVETNTTGVSASYNYDGTYGGTLDVLDGISRIGVRNTGNTAWQSYVQTGSDGNIRLLGKFPNGSAQFNNSALVTGGFGVGSGFSGASVSYGFTMVSSMAPLYALNGTPLFLHCISASSTSSFDVDWGPTDGTSTYTAKTLWYWVYRF